MVDETKAAAPAPAQAPAAAPAAAQGQAPAQQPRNQEVRRSPIVTNPKPAVDPDAPVAEPKVDESNLSAQTRAEMDAGRKALEGNKSSGAGVRAQNPVDANAQDVRAQNAPKV